MRVPRHSRGFTDINYLGQFDALLSESALFRPAEESTGSPRSLKRRSHLLEVTDLITEGRLRLDCSYSEDIHEQATVQRLAEACKEALMAMVAHCRSGAFSACTASAFPEAGLSQDELDDLVAELSEAGSWS